MESSILDAFLRLGVEEVPCTAYERDDGIDVDAIRPFILNVDSKSLWQLWQLLKAYSALCHEKRSDFPVLWDAMATRGKWLRIVPLLLSSLCEEQGERALVASAALFALFQIPGANAYQIVQSSAVLAAFQALVTGGSMALVKDQKEQLTTERPQVRRGRRSDQEAPELIMDGDVYTEAVCTARDWISSVTLNTADLHAAAVEAMVAVVLAAPPSGTGSVDRQTVNIAYDALRDLCSSRHGDAKELVRSVLRRLLPAASLQHASSGPTPAVSVPKLASNAQASVLQFLRTLLSGDNQIIVHDAVNAFLQHVCVRVPDRAEYRHVTITALGHFLREVNSATTVSFCKFVEKLGRSGKNQHRLFAVEAAASLLQDEQIAERLTSAIAPMPVGRDTVSLPEEYDGQLHLLGLVVARCMDKGPTVRARALASLSALLVSDHHEYLRRPLKQLVCICPPATSVTVSDSPLASISPEHAERVSVAAHDSPLSSLFSTSSSPMDASRIDVMALLRRRAHDERPNVRKTALQALEGMAAMLGDASLLTVQDVEIIAASTSDAAPGIRKQSIQSLTRLVLQYPENDIVRKAWLKCVPAGVLDAEATVQERSIDAVLDVVLQPASRPRDSRCAFVWELLKEMDTNCERYLRRAVAHIAKSRRLPAGLTKSLMSFGHAGSCHGAWILLAELSKHVPEQFESSSVLDSWRHVQETDDEVNCSHVLEVMSNTATKLDASAAQTVADKLLSLLRTLACPTEFMHNAVLALHAVHAGADLKRIVSTWGNELTSICLQSIQPLVEGGRYPNAEEEVESLRRAIFLLGELSLFPELSVPPQAITFAQALVPSTLTIGPQTIELDPSLRAHALIAVGKMCLNDDSIAKKCVALFAEQLNSTDAPAVRNNVIIVLSDLCVRYTSLVDRYVPLLSLCLADPNEVVRKHTIMLLTKLLDPVEEVADFAKYCLLHMLLRKTPLLLFNHMLELIFYLNDDQSHPLYNKYTQTEREREMFCFPNKHNESKRQAIYTVLLQSLTDEQKFHLSGKICTEILAGVCDGAVEADSGVLSDALQLLLCKDIKISTVRARTDDEEAAAAETQMQQALQAVRGKLLSKMMKVNLVEHIIPVVIELKNVLEKRHSPLLRYVMLYLKDLMSDYKEEVNDILVADPQLAHEVEYDLRRFDEEQRQLQRQKAAAVRTPAQQSVRPAVDTPRTPGPVAVQPSPQTPLRTPRTPGADAGSAPFSAPRLRRTISAPTKVSELASPTRSSVLLPDPEAENREFTDDAAAAALLRTRSAPTEPSEARKRDRVHDKGTSDGAEPCTPASPQHAAKSVRLTRARSRPLRQPNL